MTAVLLFFALLLDACLGEPQALWSRVPHPAVVMGRAVAALERRLNGGARQRLAGVICVAVLVLGAGLLGILLTALPLGWLWSLLGGAILLAQRSLVDHVAAVATALRVGLPEGRHAVAMIVGRDTAEMEVPDVARAAIESAAENLSDGVVAPAFWFLVAGLPGILVYKVVNTADSMIGHRTPRYDRFGWAAARLDDGLNLIPARITAVLLTGLYGLWRAWPAIVRDARRHRSPNAGWPEAAAARALGLALSGPRSYHGARRDFPYVHPDGARDIGAAEIDRATGLLWRVWGVLVVTAGLIALLQ